MEKKNENIEYKSGSGRFDVEYKYFLSNVFFLYNFLLLNWNTNENFISYFWIITKADAAYLFELKKIKWFGIHWMCYYGEKLYHNLPKGLWRSNHGSNITNMTNTNKYWTLYIRPSHFATFFFFQKIVDGSDRRSEN